MSTESDSSLEVPGQVELEVGRISEIAADAVRMANTSVGPNDDRAVCQGLQALTEAVLLLTAHNAEMVR